MISGRVAFGGRGHATGELWNPDGTHVATVTQEVLLRVAR